MVFDFAIAFNNIMMAMVDNPAYLIFLVMVLFMIPLSLFGVIHIYTWISTWSKLKSGWLKVRKKLSNGRWVEFWARPTGRKIKIKGEDGLQFEIPIKIEKEFLGYDSKLKGSFKRAGKPTQEEYALAEQVRGKLPGPEEEFRVDAY